MERFTIFLCIVIGHVLGHLQGVELGKDDLKAYDNARESPYPYVKETVNLDQYLQSKYDQEPSQSGSSSEAETDEKPPSLVMRSTVASDVKQKSGQNVHLESLQDDVRSFLKHSVGNISAENNSMNFRSFSDTSAMTRNTGKSFAIKNTRSFPEKQNQLNAINRMLEPVFGELHRKPRRHKYRGDFLSYKPPNETKLRNTKREKRLVQNPQKQETKTVTIPQEGLGRASTVSYSAMRSLLKKLPDVLQSKILITDDAEKVVFENYVKSQTVPTKALDAYNLAKKDERELLKRLLPYVPIILPTYKSLRKGVAWNYTRLHNKFRKYFQDPFTALSQYEAVKEDEFVSLDSFLIGSRQSGAAEGTLHTATVEAGTSKHQQIVRLTHERQKRNTEEFETSENQKTEKRESEGNAKPEEEEILRIIDAEEEEEEDEEQKEEEDEENEEEDNEDEESEDEEKLEDEENSEDEENYEIEEEETEEKEEDETEEAEKEEKEGEKASKKSEEPLTCGLLKIQLTKAQIEEFVTSHNDARRRETAADMLELVWDEDLAIAAQALANTCKYGHKMLIDCKGRNMGQSLWCNYFNNGKEYVKQNISEVTYSWANENKDWNYDKNMCKPGKVCGHWEILSGSRVRHVGCGYAQCPVLEDEAQGVKHGHGNYVVCDYYPFVNTFEKGKHCSNCGKSTVDLDQKGWKCKQKLCVPCDPKSEGCHAASGAAADDT